MLALAFSCMLPYASIRVFTGSMHDADVGVLWCASACFNSVRYHVLTCMSTDWQNKEKEVATIQMSGDMTMERISMNDIAE